ncbi:hypothetical protein Pcinc_018699 [Petrolisthes cinctipes]|uniref:Pro-resilin n=1 Tax=Petrolisthes cinctipes TaxID=88211 RepID=A0AAE1FLL6_PETCI|nr:hypothetical protein Pcinc_018699 [Petrolisthes cinctipes]
MEVKVVMVMVVVMVVVVVVVMKVVMVVVVVKVVMVDSTQVVFVLVCVAAATSADQRPGYSYPSRSSFPQGSYDYSPPQIREDPEEARYDFDFVVLDDETGTDFSRQEAREGNRTEGSYSILLPDGRLQTVTYYVDGDSGFVAEVSYDGEAEVEDSFEAPQTYLPPTRTPKKSYEHPHFSNEDPRNSYEHPHQSYEHPHNSYEHPHSSNEHPHNSYEQPLTSRPTFGFRS